jgi:hypothetical protein
MDSNIVSFTTSFRSHCRLFQDSMKHCSASCPTTTLLGGWKFCCQLSRELLLRYRMSARTSSSGADAYLQCGLERQQKRRSVIRRERAWKTKEGSPQPDPQRESFPAQRQCRAPRRRSRGQTVSMKTRDSYRTRDYIPLILLGKIKRMMIRPANAETVPCTGTLSLEYNHGSISNSTTDDRRRREVSYETTTPCECLPKSI